MAIRVNSWGTTGTDATSDFEDREIELKESDPDQIERAFAIRIQKTKVQNIQILLTQVQQSIASCCRKIKNKAVTRGRQHKILIGQIDIIKQLIAPVMKDRRYTAFKEIFMN